MLEHPAAFHTADAHIAVPSGRDAGGGVPDLVDRDRVPSPPARCGPIRPQPPAEGEDLGAEERPLPCSLRLAFIVTASLALWTPIVAAVRALV